VALAIKATKTVCVHGSPRVFALGAGAVDHTVTGVALQALVGTALGVCTRQRDALTTAGVDTLVHVAPRGRRAR
jgi:aminoglycoside N3'-acetyltransferase